MADVKPARPHDGWAVVNYAGDIWLWTVAHTRRDAIQKVKDWLPQTPWRTLQKGGCRAIKITVTAKDTPHV